MRLLVADDHAVVREGLTSLLTSEPGFEVVGQASNGIEAVAMAADVHPDVVLMDMIMPGMDGGKTFDCIREIQPAMPILLSSGYAMNGKAETIMQKGCNGFIQKPFNLVELSEKLKQVLDAAGVVNGSHEPMER